MPLEPSLTRLDAPPSGSDPARPRAVVLMLHGGKEHSAQRVDGRSASWRRLAALQRSITPDLHAAGASTWLLRYRTRGWDGGADKIADARWALAGVRREVGEVPVVLLGHSMGARTAVQVADDPLVLGVVALAPWLPAGEPIRPLSGAVLRAAHGRRDRITSYRATRAYVERARSVAAEASLRDMGWAGHYLLSRVGAWNAFVTEETLACCLTSGPSEHPDRVSLARVVQTGPDDLGLPECRAVLLCC